MIFLLLPPPSHYMVLSPDDARTFVNRWRPKFSHGSLLSHESVLTGYTRAIMHLSQPTCIGLAVASSPEFAVVIHKDAASSVAAYSASSLLFSPSCAPVHDIKQVQRWFIDTFDAPLVSSTLMHPTDRYLWKLGEFDI